MGKVKDLEIERLENLTEEEQQKEIEEQTFLDLQIEEHESNYQALVFPNPTSEILNIRTNNFENITYSLYDAQKKLIIRNILCICGKNF